ncbi:MAG TPA: hypothetical protein VII01_12545 [Solirubrobacteraceae bacterium]
MTGKVIADGKDTPGFDPGGPPEGPAEVRAGRSEGDLLAERRARRAIDSGEAALVRRAEAAEATVQTLERHVSTLQHRLAEAEEEQRRLAELLDSERGAALEREHELRRVKQREYAEQQLRVEAEDRLLGAERDNRAETESIARRLAASEDGARELGVRLEAIQRQLAEAEQTAAAEGVALRRAELALESRLTALEERVAQMQRGLEDERAARERSERQLLAMRQGHRQMEGLLGDIRGIVQRLLAAARTQSPVSSVSSAPPPRVPAPPARPAPVAPPPVPGTQAPLIPAPETPPPVVDGPSVGVRPSGAAAVRAGGPEENRGAEMAEALADAVERLRARAEAAAGPPAIPRVTFLERPPHKHSMSLIGRLRNRRKQRRGR